MKKQESGSSRREFIRRTGIVVSGLASGTIASGASIADPPKAQKVDVGTPGARFSSLIAKSEPLMAPGAFDVLTARLIETLGFEAAVVGGSAVSANGYGLPDHGLVSVTELIEFSGRIANAIDIPVMADADDCGGSAIAVYRAVQGFERAGLAAVMIEDHVQAKHLSQGGRLVPADEMVNKIRAAVDARRDQSFTIVARGDALSIGLSKDRALDRGAVYAEAGADILFFAGLAQDEMPAVADQMGKPLMTTVNNTPMSELRRNRVSLAVYASQAVNAAMGAAYNALRQLKDTGQVSGIPSVPRSIRSSLTRTQESIERGRQYGLTGY